MASLILKVTPQRTVRLSKRVTSIGRGPQNDVRIDSRSVEVRHAHVLKDRSGFRIFATDSAPITVNGRRRTEWSLTDGDELRLGDVDMLYRDADPFEEETTTDEYEPLESTPPRPVIPRTDSSTEFVPLEAFKKLYKFSAKISQSPTFDALKRNLLDAVIELADADTGFMILRSQSGSLELDVGRDCRGNDLPREQAHLSDSIVADVLKRRQPILISDAMTDSIFSDSRSVVNYRLRSVIAVPIPLAEEIVGVLYLGCNRKPSAFSTEFLDVLMVFAAQAGLLVGNAIQVASLKEDNAALKQELDKRTFGEIVGGCPSMLDIFKAISRCAPADISVLVVGETGTGKEMIAHEIHRKSSRASGPFVAINMSAIPDSLLEAELFGYVKGAFTGALTDRKGKFAFADGGTLFLDEIGDMPLSLQSKLLRVLQERRIEPVGSNHSEAIDIRLISATNRNLDEMQDKGSFRPDLFYRLNEVRVALPPLRERGDDVVLLASYFLAKYAEQMDRRVRRFTPKAVAAMKRYGWRGNVRELEAKIKKAVVMGEGPALDVEDLELAEGGMTDVLNLRDAKEAYARRYIREVLELNGGNRSKTARDLGIDPRTVYKYLEGK